MNESRIILRLIRGTLLLPVAALTFTALAQESPQPQVISPEVSPERKLTFRIRAPKAEAVRLNSSDLPGFVFGRPGQEMTKGGDGVWQITIGPIQPGAYRYNFNVDDVSVIDPRNPATSEANENTWSLVQVPGSDFMDTKDVPHGAVAEVTYYSSTLQRNRRMHVYTPPGYESADAKYPVFYLLHGAFDCDDSWSSVGRAGFILDNLIAAGKAKPMVVVMPAGHTGPFRFGMPFTDEFARDFVNDIMPLVEKRYRLHADRANRAIAGLSMGGAQTLNIGVAHLDKFAWLGVYSSGVFGIERSEGGTSEWETKNKTALDDAKLKDGLKLVWFATGKEDFLLRTSQATVDMLKKHGFAVTYKETDGGHTWINWREYLHEFAPQLFQGTATPAAANPTGAANTTPRRNTPPKIELTADDKAAFPPAPAGFDTRRDAIAQGKTEPVNYESKIVGITRRMIVYTPPGYSAEKKYPVLYLLHGIGDDEMTWWKEGRADAILDNLHEDGKVTPMIVVMPNGRADKNLTPRSPWSEQGPAFAAFEKEFLEDVIPFLEAHYSTQADREHRALAGLSMGGGQSLNFGLRHLEAFAWIGGFSSAPNTKAAAELVPAPAETAKQLKLLWISCGDKDGLFGISQGFHRYLKERDVPHIWHVDVGGHTREVWRNDLYLFAQQLFR